MAVRNPRALTSSARAIFKCHRQLARLPPDGRSVMRHFIRWQLIIAMSVHERLRDELYPITSYPMSYDLISYPSFDDEKPVHGSFTYELAPVGFPRLDEAGVARQMDALRDLVKTNPLKLDLSSS